jgi:hypothetical protein
MDTIKIQPIHQISPVIENQPNYSGGHSFSESLAIRDQLCVCAGLVPVLQECYTCLGELGTKSV